jgi:transcriptional regulator with XRE-family HTH domain
MENQRNFWGRLITDIRDEQRISQRKLSVKADVNRSTLRRIEDGTARGEIDVIEHLLNVLGYELEALRHEAVKERDRVLRELQNNHALKGQLALKNLLTMMPIKNSYL